MMFTNAILATAVLAASAVTAAPADVVPRQNDRLVQMCVEPDMKGCTSWSPVAGQCENLDDSLNNKIVSFATGANKCIFYIELDCVVERGAVQYQGSIANLANSDLKLANKAISSYSCIPA
ncbi:hypothetical protein LZ554_000008 [Drepanopeziza brunnea f. sp. 'monogermtubi']|nr:hypothetical protein LZ554_000008 [Drepanopeziza brunnea f. sp. 'monogermtubi']